MAHFLKEMKLKGKKAAVFGCYGWSGEGNKKLRAHLTEAGFSVIEEEVRCNWNPAEEELRAVDELAKALG